MQSKNTKSKTASVATKKALEPTNTQQPVVAVESANKIVEQNLQNKVVEVKKNTITKNTTQATTQQTTPQVETAPVASAPVATTPVATTQVAGTRGKKNTKTTQVEQQVVQQVVQQVAQPVAQPVEQTQTAGAKGKRTRKTETATTPETAPETTPAQVQKAGKTRKTKQQAEVVAQPVAQEEQEGEEEQVGGKLRYFKLYYNDQFKGRYCVKKPKQAANKAFSSIIKETNTNGQTGNNTEINFSIKECTRNSKHKEYRYVGKRLALTEPVPVYIPHTGSVSTELREERKVSNVSIRQNKVETKHSGREVTTNTGSTFLLSDGGQVFKKIIYHFHNKIQQAPKVVEEIQATA